MGTKAELHPSHATATALPAPARVRRGLREAELPAVSLIAGLLILFVVALLFRPVHFHIGGAPCRLSRGATAADALQAIGLRSTPGDLLSVTGDVLQPGRGRPPQVLRNGRPLPLTARVRHDDNLTVVPAANVIEPVRERTRLLDAPRVRGYMPPAVMGTSRVRLGVMSGLSVLETTTAVPTVVAADPATQPKAMALTFDDGPWPTTTRQILDILAKHKAHATFFVIGGQIAANRATLKREIAEGHEIGVYTWRHANLVRTSSSAIIADLDRCRRAIEEVTGQPVRLMRPPYGAINARARGAINQTGLRIIMWSADTNDWKKPGSGVVYSRILNGARRGAIVLCHDGGGYRGGTVAAVARAVPALQQRGYELVTVSQLLGLQPRPQGGAIVLADGRRLEVRPPNPAVTILIDGKPALLPEEPVEIQGQLLLPVRPVLDLLGLKWSWDQQAQALTLAATSGRLVTRVNSLKIETGPEQTAELPAPPILYRSTLMVPLWVTLTAAQATARYDPGQKTLDLISPSYATKTATVGIPPPAPWGQGVNWRSYLTSQ